MQKPKAFIKHSFMAKYPLTSHEYSYDIGSGFVPNITCSPDNTTDNGDGTYTITGIPDEAIAIGKFRVRVKSSPGNKASAWLYNSVAFTGGAEPETYELTLSASGDIDAGDLPIVFNVDGEDLVDNKITWPAGTYFDASSIIVDGYVCEPSTLHVLMDANKSVDIVLTPVAAGSILPGFSFVDTLANDNDRPVTVTGTVYSFEDITQEYQGLDNTTIMAVNSKIALKYTADTKSGEFGIGRSDDLFYEKHVKFLIDDLGVVSVSGKDVSPTVLTVQPTVGQFLMIQRLTLRGAGASCSWRVGVTLDGNTFLSSQDVTHANYCPDNEEPTKAVAGIKTDAFMNNEFDSPQYKA